MFDAEHFFDGYKNNKDYALSCLKAAYDNGADGLFFVIQMGVRYHKKLVKLFQIYPNNPQ